MRISVLGDSRSVKVLKGYLEKSGYLVTDERADYEVVLSNSSSVELNSVVLEGISCSLEQACLSQLQELGIGKFILERNGRSKSDRALHVRFNVEDSEVVEKGILRAVLLDIKGRVPKDLPYKKPWYKSFLSLGSLLLLSLPVTVQAQTRTQDFLTKFAVRPILLQPTTNFPIVRFWSGSVVVNAGDSVNNALRIVCISGCGGASSFSDNTAFTFGTTAVNVTAFVFDDTATNTVTENNAAAPRMSGSRIAYFNLTNQAGTAFGTLTGTSVDVNCTGGCGGASAFLDNSAFTFGTTGINPTGFVVDDTATNTVTENNAGAPRMNTNRIVYNMLTGPTGTQTGTASSPVRTDPTGTTVQPISINQTSVNNDVDVISVIPGTGPTNLGKLEDAPYADADVGVAAYFVREEQPATNAGAEGDYTPGKSDRVGRPYAAPPRSTISNALNALNAVVELNNWDISFEAGFYLATGTLDATLTPECSFDAATYVAGSFYNIGTGAITPTLVVTNPNAYNQLGILCGSGTQRIRVRVSTFTSGSALGAIHTGPNVLHFNYANLRNASGTEIGTSATPIRNDPTGTTAQPITAASLPLPTGAATETTLATRVADATVTGRFPAGSTPADNESNAVTITRLGTYLFGFDGTTWDRIPATSVDGLLVNLGANNDVTIPANSSVNLTQIVGTAPAAHDAAMSTDSVPFTQAGYSETPEDSDANTNANRASADADKTRILTNRYGVVYTNPCQGPFKWTYHENSSSTLTDATVHASCGTGLFNYICSVTFSTGAATAFNLFIEDSTTTTILGPWYLEAVAGRGASISFAAEGGKKQTTSATLISVTTSAAIAHSIDIQGSCAP